MKFFEWEDPSLRGGKGNAALSLLFADKDDAIFYKYIDDFEPLFNAGVQEFLFLYQSHAEEESILNQLCDFQARAEQLLRTLAETELTKKEAFPPVCDSPDQGIDFAFKTIIVGDPSVGKSSTILRYTDKAFRRSYISTIGVNITQKQVQIEDQECQFVFWDCAGQIKYQNMRQKYYQGATGIIIVYDIINRQTFESVSDWYHDVIKNIENPEECRFILCGNKKDKESQAEVSTEEGQALADQLNMPFFETSALTGENINDAISNLGKQASDLSSTM